MSAPPLCFVLMPFGQKPDATGKVIDFDTVYRDILQPAVEAAGLEPIRADEELAGGIIHKPMFERLILCPFAVADLTSANANVYYELGIRHAVKPRTTVIVAAAGGPLPFDVAPLRAVIYQLGADGKPSNAAGDRKTITERLAAAKTAAAQSATGGDTDSPIYQLVENFPEPDIARLSTDVFRERVDYARGVKERLRQARAHGLDEVRNVENAIGDFEDIDSGVLVDLFLSYRAVKAWKEMISLAERMPKPLAATPMIREQLALALNRDGQDARAEQILLELIKTRGPSSETYGLLGRIYKDRWDAARKAGENPRARAHLDKAIDAYLRGFETDWRDAYPGVNAVTLMEMKEPPDARQAELLPVVAYAVKRRIAKGEPDYWDHATLLELAVLARDEDAAQSHLGDALIAVREKWEPETTARNLALIHDVRTRRGDADPWLPDVLGELQKASGA